MWDPSSTAALFYSRNSHWHKNRHRNRRKSLWSRAVISPVLTHPSDRSRQSHRTSEWREEEMHMPRRSSSCGCLRTPPAPSCGRSSCCRSDRAGRKSPAPGQRHTHGEREARAWHTHTHRYPHERHSSAEREPLSLHNDSRWWSLKLHITENTAQTPICLLSREMCCVSTTHQIKDKNLSPPIQQQKILLSLKILFVLIQITKEIYCYCIVKNI